MTLKSRQGGSSHLFSLTSLLVALFALSACGGSGGSNNQLPQSASGGGSSTGTPTGAGNHSQSPPPPEAELVLHLPFDEDSGSLSALDLISGRSIPVHSALVTAGRTEGAVASALRTDGFSTHLDFAALANFSEGGSVELWIALESTPSDRAVPHDKLTPATILSVSEGALDAEIWVNAFGEFGLRVVDESSDEIIRDVIRVGTLDLARWYHMGLQYSASDTVMSLLVNGEAVASLSATWPPGDSEKRIRLGRGDGRIETNHDMTINGINAALDNVQIFTGLRSVEERVSELDALKSEDASNALIVPESRFVNDIHRPRLHAMPTANWTNEPHGLIKTEDGFHLYHQRNPAGPFWSHIRWGHLQSEDGVTWEVLPDALSPELQDASAGYDMKGIWSGDTVADEGMIFSFYTQVNHGSSFNPGIALATSTDPTQTAWEKQGPLFGAQGARDFRDPYLWEDEGGWHMIIGAALETGGGLVYYTSEDLFTWRKQSRFSSIPYREMDIGSQIWEMPLFEQIEGDTWILLANPIGGEVGGFPSAKITRPVYWLGHWDGTTFTPFYTAPKSLEPIHGLLAPTSEKLDDHTLVAMGIVDERRSQAAQYAAGWAHTFSFLREWYVLDDGLTLGQRPFRGLESLRSDTILEKQQLADVISGRTLASGRQLEVKARITPVSPAGRFGIMLGANSELTEYTTVYFDPIRSELVVDKRRMSLSEDPSEKVISRATVDQSLVGPIRDFHVLIDHSIAEIFINEALAISLRFYPALARSTEIKAFAENTRINVSELSVWSLGDDESEIVSAPVEASQVAHGVSVPYRGNINVIASFEDPQAMLSDGWSATGSFSNPSNKDAWVGTSGVSRIGLRALSTCEMNQNRDFCDPPMGELRSPDLLISSDKSYLAGLMAGGGNADVGIRVERVGTGEILESISPDECAPSYVDSGEDWFSVDLSDHVGETVSVVIFDQSETACGFISLDYLHFRNDAIH